ncbi:RraA family protein [Microlunatus aurantiacus]|uniref:Putative 4-hydroxy-4-methyl-2-oxoglutarate aldolase n=1 Tax=Microlunatus aurantiacus TaxID=446786 RepID=A0ABP7CKH2_9ACTN
MPSSDSADLIQRLAAVDTTSLKDAGAWLRVLPAALRPIRPGARLLGRALTVDAREDLMPVLAGLAEAGPGDVLVIAGHPDHAVAGELFATEALRRGVAGIVIDGRCRDSRILAGLGLPVFARGVAPSACPARAVPVIQVPILIGDVTVRPGDLVLGDDDGLVVGSDAEVREAVDGAEAIQQREGALRAAIEGGESLFDHLNYDEHVAALREGRDSKLNFS